MLSFMSYILLLLIEFLIFCVLCNWEEMNELHLLRDVFTGGSWLASDPLVNCLVKRHLTLDVFCALGTNYKEYEWKKKDFASNEVMKDWLNKLLEESFIAQQEISGVQLAFTETVISPLRYIIAELVGKLCRDAWRNQYLQEMSAYELWGTTFSINSIVRFWPDHDGYFVTQEQIQRVIQTGAAASTSKSKQRLDVTRALEQEIEKADKAFKQAKTQQHFTIGESEFGKETLENSDSAEVEGKQSVTCEDNELFFARNLQPSGSFNSKPVGSDVMPLAVHDETNWLSKQKKTIEYRRKTM